MAIDAAEVLRIAELARLQIDHDEAERLAHDLHRIVEYVDSLAEVELPADIEGRTYFDEDVHREDRSVEGLSHDAALLNAPETDGTFFLVRRVVERGSEES